MEPQQFQPLPPSPLEQPVKQVNPRRRLLTIWAVVIIVLVGLVILIGVLLQPKTSNQFGKIIRIQNYSQKVNNLSSSMRDAMESSLYNVVKRNSNSSFDPTTVNDALIRNNSDSQSFSASTNVYDGNFIVDMASIKQSYQVQYAYSTDKANTDTGGSPVIISCLPKEKLIYGEFSCADNVTQQSTANDAILQYLPYQSYDFSISPDATKGKTLTLDITLTIPDMDLSGSAASKQATIKLYKQEVTDWITSKGVDPSKYTLQYNYDDNGNPINQPAAGGD